MLPMNRYTCIAAGPNNGRICYAGQMPDPPTPVSAMVSSSIYQIEPGWYLVQWDDDKSFYAYTPAQFAADFELIIP